MNPFRALFGKGKSGKDKSHTRLGKAKTGGDDELTIAKLAFEETPRSINLRRKIADLCEGESTYDIAAALAITTVKLLKLVKPKDSDQILQIFFHTVTTGIEGKSSKRSAKKKAPRRLRFEEVVSPIGKKKARKRL
jgi:hypothetical protein